MWLRRKTGAVEWLVVGLGNPGPKYAETRHNAGVGALTALAEKTGVSVSRAKFRSLCGEGEIGGKKCLLMFPQTYMNDSGLAVAEAMRFYKLTPERVLVFSDDVSLSVGTVRVRRKGSDGGQKGLRSITELIGSEDFPRIKIGVGQKPHPQMELADWVLSKFSTADKKLLAPAYEAAAAAAELVIAGDIEGAMNRYSR